MEKGAGQDSALAWVWMFHLQFQALFYKSSDRWPSATGLLLAQMATVEQRGRSEDSQHRGVFAAKAKEQMSGNQVWKK